MPQQCPSLTPGCYSGSRADIIVDLYADARVERSKLTILEDGALVS